jgi:hypothetical protein
MHAFQACCLPDKHPCFPNHPATPQVELGLRAADLEARLKAASEERTTAVAAAKSTAEAAAAKELQAYQQNNAKAYDAIQKRCNEAEAAKEEVGRGLGRCGMMAALRFVQTASVPVCWISLPCSASPC